ncbi:hypothetical protein D0Y65_051025 [Glycine soja]|uniref:MULE transposase domain-containing protein n=1 Tax=Glycine soja TaxID=3848 RepID=A0A445FEE2_GLYSO|nr:hypothetical protein D0Y65_051025 [Glycine soja]
MQAKPFHVALHFANSSGKTGSMAFCQSRLRNRCSFFQVSPIGVVNPFHMGMHFANSRAKQVAAFSAWHFAIDVGGNRDGCSFFSGVANRGAVFFFRYILVYGEFGYNNLIFQWKGVEGIHNPFWNDALYYNNINWSHPNEEDICGLEMPSSFNVGQELYVVDGTHLYGKYRGTLLMATSQDGNGGVLPLAFVVVEGETLTAWSWFLAHLREHVIDKNGICLISDRHASIKSVVANETLGWQPPHTYHVYCIRHITSNFNRKFNNAKQKEMFKKLAYIPCKHTFDQNFENFCQLSPAIATWIDRISKEKWTMAYDKEGRRYDYMTTNLSECINKYSALHYSCSHIIAACGYVSINYFQYEDVVYTNEHILKAYSAQWWPLGNEATISPSDDSWTLILDPSTIRAKGRPKSTRIRNEMD